MKHLLLITIISGLSAFVVKAQPPSSAQDTLLFRQHLSGYHIGRSVDIHLLLDLYKRFKDPKTKDVAVEKWFDANDPDYVFDVGYFEPSRFWGSWHIDNALLPDSLRHELLAQVRYYRWTHPDRRADKKRLVENISAFRAGATARPPFLHDIDSLYGGSVEKYVDALYGKSILGSKWRMAMFTRKPTVKRLVEDPGVQFALDLALYDLWVKSVRDSRSADETDVRPSVAGAVSTF